MNNELGQKIRYATCKGCGRSIIFAMLKKTDGDDFGWTPVPLDPRAPVYVVKIDEAGRQVCERSEDACVSHFATCPEANRFSRSRKT